MNTPTFTAPNISTLLERLRASDDPEKLEAGEALSQLASLSFAFSSLHYLMRLDQAFPVGTILADKIRTEVKAEVKYARGRLGDNITDVQVVDFSVKCLGGNSETLRRIIDNKPIEITDKDFE